MIPRTMLRTLREFALPSIALSLCLAACGDPTVADCGGMTPGGTMRDCGWTVAGTYQCQPGVLIGAGCAAGCMLGSCTGDPIMRVCAGGAPCTFAQAILTVDDADTQGDQGTMRPGVTCDADPMSCPAAIFRCPQGGQFTVMVAPYQTSQAFSTMAGGAAVSCAIATGTVVLTP